MRHVNERDALAGTIGVGHTLDTADSAKWCNELVEAMLIHVGSQVAEVETPALEGGESRLGNLLKMGRDGVLNGGVVTGERVVPCKYQRSVTTRGMRVGHQWVEALLDLRVGTVDVVTKRLVYRKYVV